jgi:cyclase
VKGGRVVKGVSFENLKDAGDAVALSRRYNEEGADELVFLDISATLEQRDATREMVQQCARELSIPLTVGGGIRSVEDANRLLLAGADKIAVNTAAVERPELISELSRGFGAQAVVLAIDAKHEDDHSWRVYTHASTRPTQWLAAEWAAKGQELGAGEILLTIIDADGQQTGFANGITRTVVEATTIPVIASGGAGNAGHFVEVFTTGRADAALAASIFHFGIVTIAEVKQKLREADIPVRMC